VFGTGRCDWIRTSDFSLPKRALYQAELRPVLLTTVSTVKRGGSVRLSLTCTLPSTTRRSQSTLIPADEGMDPGIAAELVDLHQRQRADLIPVVSIQVAADAGAEEPRRVPVAKGVAANASAIASQPGQSSTR
jgi:hypothetical protein